MPRFSPQQIITAISTVYLVLLTALAAYALHRANSLSLPIPNVQSAFTLALPALAGIALETLISFQSSIEAKGELHYSKIFQAITAVFLIYETVLATLSGTHLAPLGGLWCPLHDQWQSLYHSKDSGHIRAIQEALQCCGFASTRDMAWPFPGGGSGADTCAVRFDRDTACLEPWRSEERKVAVMLLVVPLGVFLWKVALFLVPSVESNWLPSTIRLPSENSNGADRPRPAITYRDIEQHGDDDSLRQEVNRLNKDSDLATHVESGRRGRVSVEQDNGWTHD